MRTLQTIMYFRNVIDYHDHRCGESTEKVKVTIEM